MATELFVSRRGSQTWAALCEQGRAVELRVEIAGREPQVGRILKARVSKVLPGIQSAFLAVGAERDAFLHVTDLLLPGERPQPHQHTALPGAADLADDDFEDEAPEDDGSAAGLERPAAKAGGAPPATRAPIQDRLKEGRELLVQVAREALGSKGARVTCYLTLPGRRLVLFPQLAIRGISRRIDEPEERTRLQALVEALPGAGLGFVARTAARGAAAAELEQEAAWLIAEWERIQAAAAAGPAPAEVHREFDLLLRLLRDAPAEGLERIVVDDADDRQRALDYLGRADPALAPLVELHLGPEPLFEAYGLDQDIERALRPRVWLKSGGYLVIEQTEALVTIDVNTGKYVGRQRMEETVLRTNLEAAEEIARQLRLRDLGGIIVIDFIDMDLAESRRSVIEALTQALRADRARTQIHGLSELGLLQLTRKRTRPGLEALLTRGCPLCAGQGRIRNAQTVAFSALSEVRRLAATTEATAFVVRVHPEVAQAIRTASADEPITLIEDGAMRPDRVEVRAAE